jgi:hypothetical protein
MSVNGAFVNEYLGYGSFADEETANTILFPSGSEFLVCRVTEEKSPVTAQPLKAIYLRNIVLGLTESQTFLWTDSFLADTKFVNYERMLNYRIRKQKEIYDQGVQLIQKSASIFARAYLQSPFFYLSLRLGKSFVIIQNPERANEIFLKFKDEDQNQLVPSLAGIKILDVVRSEIMTMPGDLIHKVKPVYFQFYPGKDKDGNLVVESPSYKHSFSA